MRGRRAKSARVRVSGVGMGRAAPFRAYLDACEPMPPELVAIRLVDASRAPITCVEGVWAVVRDGNRFGGLRVEERGMGGAARRLRVQMAWGKWAVGERGTKNAMRARWCPLHEPKACGSR